MECESVPKDQSPSGEPAAALLAESRCVLAKAEGRSTSRAFRSGNASIALSDLPHGKKTVRKVLAKIIQSNQTVQFRMYQASSCTRSSRVNSLRPLTCQ